LITSPKRFQKKKRAYLKEDGMEGHSNQTYTVYNTIITIIENKYTMDPIFLASMVQKNQIKLQLSMSSWIIVLEEQTQVANEPCYLSNISTSTDSYVQILNCEHDFKKNKKNETQIRLKNNTWGRKKPRTMNVNYQAAK